MKGFTLIILIFLTVKLYAEWIPVSNNEKCTRQKDAPQFLLINDNETNTIVKFEISGFDLQKADKTKGKTFDSVDLLTDIYISETGMPKLPYLTKVIAIPDNTNVTVEIVKTGYTKIVKNINIEPALKSWKEGTPKPKLQKNNTVYSSSNIYPNTLAEISKPSVFRDFRIIRLSVYPMQYNPKKQQLEVLSSITVKLKYNNTKANVINPKTTAQKAISPAFGKIYRSFISNYQSVLNSKYGGKESGHDLMLCIMPDEFANAFQTYADWKRKTGIDIHITKFSDIDANANNPVKIKNHIADAYHNWDVPPTYVLIIGDEGVFPSKIMYYDNYSYANEDYFVEVDGDDYFPEMMIGRLTNDDVDGLKIMLNKFKKYEKEPYTTNPNWFKKGICCSNNFYTSQVKTKRFTAKVMMEDGGFTSVDTLMSNGEWGSGCSMDLTDIKNAINQGRSFLNYRGEGWAEGWAASCYQFQYTDVETLNNGEKLTFVTSIGCGVAMFNATDMTNCFGETWLEMGTIDQPKGAIAFVGPTSNTHTTYNNRIDKGIYVGMFREGMECPGQALLRGKLYMYNYFGDDELVEYESRVFTVLGDPSIHIWKGFPQEISFTHPQSVPVGTSNQEFTVTTTSGTPIQNAQVCVSGDNVFTTGRTDENGKAILSINVETPETINILIRGSNLYPKQTTISAIRQEKFVSPINNTITEVEGNSDEYINPNEKWEISFTLKNWGTNSTNNVKATLSVIDNNNVTLITTSPVEYGNINSNEQKTASAFKFFIKPNFPINEDFTLKLHVSSGDKSWDYTNNINVTGCALRYKYSIINDRTSESPNYRLDIGEEALIYTSIVNIGNGFAKNVKAILSSNSQYVSILDSIGSFGNINEKEVKINKSNYFKIKISPNCPDKYNIDFNIKLETQNGFYPYSTIRNFVLSVDNPKPSDITGPDSYGYIVISDKDRTFDNAPVYNWIEINNIGNKINVTSEDFTKTVTLPFDFKYYGKIYHKLRISIDGWIAFGEGTETNHKNKELPHDDNVNAMVAVFWDNLTNNVWGYYEGNLFYYYDTENHRYIIEWNGFPHANDEQSLHKEFFQVILLNPEYYSTQTGDGDIICQYKSLKKIKSCSLGIEDDSQTIGLSYLYNNNFQNTAFAIDNGTAIKFTTDLPSTLVSINDKYTNVVNDGCKLQNYPNPFDNSTTIQYTIPESTNVAVTIYNINGQLVYSNSKGKQQAGTYSFTWSPETNQINNNSGLYLCRIQTDKVVKTIKMFFINK